MNLPAKCRGARGRSDGAPHDSAVCRKENGYRFMSARKRLNGFELRDYEHFSPARSSRHQFAHRGHRQGADGTGLPGRLECPAALSAEQRLAQPVRPDHLRMLAMWTLNVHGHLTPPGRNLPTRSYPGNPSASPATLSSSRRGHARCVLRSNRWRSRPVDLNVGRAFAVMDTAGRQRLQQKSSKIGEPACPYSLPLSAKDVTADHPVGRFLGPRPFLLMRAA